MTRDSKWAIIVTYQEWVIWTTSGTLRIGDNRCTKLKNLEQTPHEVAFRKPLIRRPTLAVARIRPISSRTCVLLRGLKTGSTSISSK